MEIITRRATEPHVVINTYRLMDLLDHLLPVDPAHNLKDHELPVAVNVTKIVDRFNLYGLVDLDVLLVAALCHDRNRFFVGHLPINALTDFVIKKSGLEPKRQKKAMQLVKNHSELSDSSSLEDAVLWLADKMEYFSFKRVVAAEGKFPEVIERHYRKEWKGKVSRVYSTVCRLDSEDLFRGIKDIFDKKIEDLNQRFSSDIRYADLVLKLG